LSNTNRNVVTLSATFEEPDGATAIACPEAMTIMAAKTAKKQVVLMGIYQNCQDKTFFKESFFKGISEISYPILPRAAFCTL
jgi:hypothetical protein